MTTNLKPAGPGAPITFVFIYLIFISTILAADKYQNFSELSLNEKKGIDFKITVDDKNSKETILAIHGGQIDWGTSIIASALANGKYNLYLFEGIKPKNNIDLHITSNNFDEPLALNLASRSKRCLSIHGHQSPENRICLGGRDTKLQKKMFSKLNSKGYPFRVQLLCPGLEGTGRSNIVNRCQNKGVQFEFSSSLRKILLSDKLLMESLARTVQEALEESN